VAIPKVGARWSRLATIDGGVPAIGRRPSGRSFAPRPGHAEEAALRRVGATSP
jgi:hypothetical protein